MAKSNRALKFQQVPIIRTQDRVELNADDVRRVAFALGSPDVSFSEEEAAAIMKNAYHNHPAITAALLKQLAADHSDLFLSAYDVALKGVRELGKFNPEIPIFSEESTNDFFACVAGLSGPGSERLKFDVAKLLTENIISAENTGLAESDAIVYSKKLSMIMQRRPRRKASKAWRLLLGRLK
ncbi:MAG TPA: hypothetical protein VLH08_17940 [Acidobacteriota bacterium]|nr:hypothetical protein [Acidobacteriota bacterium]